MLFTNLSPYARPETSRVVWTNITCSNRSYMSGSRDNEAKGAMPVLVDIKYRRLLGNNASRTNVPTGLGRIITSSPNFIFCNRDVNGPFWTLIE